MVFVFIFREAWRALTRNKMRSSLTVLGVTIGIGAVICVVAIGTAASDRIQEQLLLLGDNLVWVESGGRNVGGVRTGSGQTKTLIIDDMNAIVKQVSFVKACSPQADGRSQIIYNNQNWNTSLRGCTPDYLDIRKWQVIEGGPFTSEDVERAADVCVIGQTIKQMLFGSEDPLGKVIRLGKLPCRVVGVLAPKGQSVMGMDQDDWIAMPYTTVQKKISGKTWLDDVMCSAQSSDAVGPATTQIVSLMMERHKIRADQTPDFNIRTPEDQIQAQLESSRTFTLLLAAIASVSLLVGGIGIMNVMLVSVTERTHEIGIRLAVGATEENVQVQFLGEALLLSFFGGGIGVLAGIAGSALLGQILQWPMRISLQGIILAAVFSTAVGVFFGYYPARKASRLDPIEALRFE